MATGDFWNRIVGAGLSDGTPAAEGKIPVALARAVLLDTAIGSGGFTVVQARLYLKVLPGTTALTEFNDLRDSVASILQSDLEVRRQRRIVVVEALSAGGAIAERGTRIGGGVNPYATGEALRVRIRDLITVMGGTPVGSMAV